MIVIIDNYDSFTYNLFQYVGSIREDIRILRNDAVTVEEIRDMHPDHIIISPGPGRPEDAGICMELIREMRGEVPILGVCLGEQAICAAYGGVVGYAKELMHGKSSEVKIDGESPIFQGMKDRITVARYHSLQAMKDSLKDTELIVTAVTDDEEVMALEDRNRMVFGVQFHPESIMTPDGMTIIRNFLNITK